MASWSLGRGRTVSMKLIGLERQRCNIMRLFFR